VKKLLLAALLFAAGPAWAGETAYRVRYSLRGAGRDIIVQAQNSAEARRAVMQLFPGATVTGVARARPGKR